MSVEDPYRIYSEKRVAAHQFRTLKNSQPLADGHVSRGGKDLINFSGNDYLGLSRHPLLIERAQEFAAEYGAGSAASRLISGNLPVYESIEGKLAKGKGTETALVLASGYQANLTVIAALADSEAIGKPVQVFADRLCHNSMLQGVLLGGARLTRFKHNDYGHLESLLQTQTEKDQHRIVITESVFGMDGDCADLAALGGLAKKYDALLYVDEAHATGLFGPGGFGFCAEHKGQAQIAMGTFGKALGGFGAYIGCSSVMRDYLIQRCGGLVYSTALPPSVLGAIDAALDVLPQMDEARAYLRQQSERLRNALKAQGWDCGASVTQIIPVILGDEQAATDLAASLAEKGLLIPAIRPPTVPKGTSRLRFSLSAAHKAGDIDRAIDAMAQEAARYLPPRQMAS